MADAKLTALTAVTSVGVDSLLYVVVDPSGTPASNKVTGSNLFLSLMRGAPSVTGLVGINNSGSPTTQYDLSAALVEFWQPSTGRTVVRTNIPTLTNNTATAGPAANGRDQAGAFSASSWLNFYFIWDGSTVATLSSLAAPPTGPTLPTGYTHWAFCGAVRYDASATLLLTTFAGARAQLIDSTSPFSRILSNGAATSFTTVAAGTLVPPTTRVGCLKFIWSGTPGGTTTFRVRPTDSTSSQGILADLLPSTQAQHLVILDTHLNADRQLDYALNVAPASGGMNIDVTGYNLENGDS